MKYESSKKITALGVVIFSFIAVLMYFVFVIFLDSVVALIVLKTQLDDGFLKIAAVVASGLALTVSTTFLVSVGKVRGIIGGAVMSLVVILSKVIGNAALDMGGYLGLNGLIGIIFTLIFAFVGAVLGGALKRR